MTETDPVTCPRCGHPSLDHYRGFCHHPAGAVAMCGCRVIPPVYGFALLHSSTDTPDPLITGGLDDSVEVVEHTAENDDATGERRRAAFPPCTTQHGEHCLDCPRNTLAECVADLARVISPGTGDTDA